MSGPPKIGRRDGNEKEIVEALRTVGASVQQLSALGVPDLLVGYRDSTYLLEVKMPKGELTDEQVKWHAQWDGQVAIVRSIEEAFRAIGIKVTT